MFNWIVSDTQQYFESFNLIKGIVLDRIINIKRQYLKLQTIDYKFND